jgi:hypothetical protein
VAAGGVAGSAGALEVRKCGTGVADRFGGEASTLQLRMDLVAVKDLTARFSEDDLYGLNAWERGERALRDDTVWLTNHLDRRRRRRRLKLLDHLAECVDAR